MEDITKTGPVGLKGLKSAASTQQQDTEEDYLLRKISNASGKLNNILSAPAEVGVGEYALSMGYGNSSFDTAISNLSNLADINDIRGQEQPWYAQLGAGIIKGVSLAGTTFLDGTLGLLYGFGAAANSLSDDNLTRTQKFSKLWDNEISNGLQQWNNLMEEWLPNYRTDEEANNAWYKNLGTMNFWADGVIKNLGFTVGAFYSGNLLKSGISAGIGGLGKLMKTGWKMGGIGAQVTGSVLSAVNEARIEANNNTDDWERLEIQRLDDSYKKLLAERGIVFDSQEELDNYKAQDSDYQKMLNDIAERKAAMGLSVFIGNTILTSLDNIYSFGKLYRRGFQNAKLIAGGRATKAALKEGLEQAVREADDVVGSIVKEGSEYGLKKISRKQAIGRGLKTGLVEGNEEMAQSFISEASGNAQQYDSPDAYYRAMTDPNAELKTKNFMSSVIEGFTNTYGNGDKWEEFAVGFLTGLLGMPTFGKANNSDANTWLGRGKSVALSGGLFGEIGNANRINQEGQEAVDYMNSYLRKLQDQERHFVQSQSFTDAMDGFAEEGNAFEYKNAEDNEDFAAISRFAKVGRLEDLRDIIKQDFEEIDDTELEKIARFTSPQDTNIGGWRNEDGSYMSDTDEGKAQMRRELSEKRDKILREIDNYEKSVREVRAIDNNSLTEDQVNELAWLNWKVGQFDERFSSIKDDNADTFRIFSDTLLNFRDYIDESSEEGQKWMRSVNNLIDFMSYLQGAPTAISLASRIADNKKIVDALMDEDMYDVYLGESGLSYTRFTTMMNNLKDAGRIAMAADTFNKKLKEFTKDPAKIIQNRESIDIQVQQERTNVQNNQRRQQVEESSVSDLVSAARNGEDLDAMLSVLPEDMDEAQADMDAANEELNARQRVQEAQNIISSTNALVGDDTQEGLIFQVEGASDQAKQDAANLMRRSEERAESEDELLDLQREVFNDPNVLFSESDEIQSLVNQGMSQEEIAQYAQDRLDAAREVLNSAIGNLDEAKKDLEDLKEDGKRTLRTVESEAVEETPSEETGHDATPKGETMTPEEKRQQELAAKTAQLDDNLNDALTGLEEEEESPLATEPRISTPDIPAATITSQILDLASTDLSRQEPTEQANYWKPTTTRYPFGYTLDAAFKQLAGKTLDGFTFPSDKKEFNKVPFYQMAKYMKNNDGSPKYTEAQLRRMEAVYKYLDRVGAFDRVDSGQVKAGDVLRFCTVKELNDEAGDMVILLADKNGNIVGDLMSKSDLARSSANRGMLQFVEKLEREFEHDHGSDNPYIVWEFGYTTHVSKNMIGKVPFTISSETNTLNAIASQASSTGGTTKGKLILGIAMSSGKNANIAIEPGRTKAQGQSAREMATMSPINAVAGQPFMLVETSSAKRKYITVPFQMPRYDQSTQHTGLAAQVNQVVQQILNADEKDFGRLKLDFKELLAVDDMHINIDPATGKMKITITPRGEQHQTTVFNDVPSAPDAANRISKALYGQPFQVSRRYINGQINGLDYNSLVGEIAYTNLPQGGTHTVSDWFTVNPVNPDGTEVKARNPKSTGVNPEAIDRVVTIKSSNGTSYNVNTRTYEITDANGVVMDPNKQIEGWNLYRAIAYGRVQNKDLSKPYETPWGWFDATKNQFVIGSQETVHTDASNTVEEQPKTVTPAEESKDTDYEATVATNTEKMRKARLLGNQKRKALWEVLSPRQKHIIANDVLHQEQWMRQLELAWQPKTQSFSERMLRGSVDSLIGDKPLNRENARLGATEITRKEKAWFDANLPQLSNAERLHFVDRIIGVSQEGNPIEAWGQFSNGIITIANNAARGTLYHEAFHSVVHTLLTDEEYSELYDAAKTKYGDKSAEALEEILAESFRRYMEIKEKPVVGTIAKVFQTLKRWINNLFGKTAAIDNLFYRINHGQFVNRDTREVKDVTRNLWSGTQAEAKRLFFEEVYEKRLSEWDVHRINQKLARLAAQAGDSQPWVLKRSRKGGYYIAGYRNMIVTKDNYWSPGLWRGVRYRTNETSSISRQQYARDKYDIANLSEEQVNYIEERGVTTQEFNTWSNESKEIFLRCM